MRDLVICIWVSNQGRDMRHIWGRRQIYAYKILVGKSERKNHLEDIRVIGRMILKWILKNRMASGSFEKVAGCVNHVNAV
jgi:hypothetical protein